MEPNPFSDQSSQREAINPYAAPAQGYEVKSRDYDVARGLRIPAVLLLILASLTILYRLWDTVYAVTYLSTSGVDVFGSNTLTGLLVGTAIGLVMNSLVVLGSIAMLRRTSYPMAWTAAIIACIPLCSPAIILGMPFGIWALVVLRRHGCEADFSGGYEPPRYS